MRFYLGILGRISLMCLVLIVIGLSTAPSGAYALAGLVLIAWAI